MTTRKFTIDGRGAKVLDFRRNLGHSHHMPKRSSKKQPGDVNELAKAIVDQATSEDAPGLTENGKNAAPVA